jgi:hypothetical protein
VHADAGKIGHGVGQLGELDPVELDVLPRGEVAVAAIVAARDMGIRRSGLNSSSVNSPDKRRAT